MPTLTTTRNVVIALGRVGNVSEDSYAEDATEFLACSTKIRDCSHHFFLNIWRWPIGKDLSELTSYMEPLAWQLIDQCARAGFPVAVEDTGRTPEEQQQKIAQGVSKTQHSKHLPQPPEMKSEAIDVVPECVLELKDWGWTGKLETSHPAWARIGEIGESLGLDWGYRMWGWDPGHFQFRHAPTMGVEEATQ